MQEGTIGRRYARALAMSLSKESNERLEKVEGELSAVAALLDRHSGHAEFRQAMLNPSFSVSQRRGIVTELGKSQKLEDATVGFLALLVDKERIPQLPSVARAFRDEVDTRVGRVRATILTAKALDPAGLLEIVRGLEKRTGKKVIPDVAVDPSVIAGVQTRIGGLVYDATVKAQLDRLQKEFSVQ